MFVRIAIVRSATVVPAPICRLPSLRSLTSTPSLLTTFSMGGRLPLLM